MDGWLYLMIGTVWVIVWQAFRVRGLRREVEWLFPGAVFQDAAGKIDSRQAEVTDSRSVGC